MIDKVNNGLSNTYNKYLKQQEFFDISLILADFLVSNYQEIEESIYHKYTSISETYRICKKFLHEINNDYSSIFDRTINLGIMDININENQSINKSICNYINNYQNIYIDVRHNISDAFNTCHEFMHCLNLGRRLSSARFFFSENISMMSEERLANFLDKENYDNSEYHLFEHNRFYDSYNCAKVILIIDYVFKYYSNSEILTDSIIKNILIEFNSRYKNSSLNYMEFKQLIELIFASNNIDHFYQSCSHVLGIFISKYILNHFDSRKLICHYNENINSMYYDDFLDEIGLRMQLKNSKLVLDEQSFEKLFESFDISFNTYKKKL